MLTAFEEKMPLSSLVRGLLERCFSPARLDQLFDTYATEQYTRTLLFSEACELLLRVVLRLSPSVHAAYQTARAPCGVSVTAVYDKLARIEPAVVSALVRETAQDLADIRAVLVPPAAWLPGYAVRIVDGNVLAGTEKRLRVQQTTSGAALPGKALVVLAPETRLILAVIPGEDAYTQERALLADLAPLMSAQQVWVADRNFCTRAFLAHVHAHQAQCVVRRHTNFTYQPVTAWGEAGVDAQGQRLQERAITVDGRAYREVRVTLQHPTRAGEPSVELITDLPANIPAVTVAHLYLQRWSVEAVFQDVEQHFQSEIHTLAYPRAALFGFGLALVMYNIFSLLLASLERAHDRPLAAEVSGYYIAIQVAATFSALLLLTDASAWSFTHTTSPPAFAQWLVAVAQHVQLRTLKKHPRGPKKEKPKPVYNAKQPHVSTFRLLHPEQKTP